MGNEDDKNLAGRLLDTLFRADTLMEFHSLLRRVRDDSEVRSATIAGLVSLDQDTGSTPRADIYSVFAFICSYCVGDSQLQVVLTDLFHQHYDREAIERLSKAGLPRSLTPEHDVLLNLLAIFSQFSYVATCEVCDAAKLIFKGSVYEDGILKKCSQAKTMGGNPSTT